MSVEVAGYIMASLFAIGGLLSIAAAVCDWDWFFQSEGVRMLTWRLTRPWQRVVYMVIGIGILAMAAKIIMEIANFCLR